VLILFESLKTIEIVDIYRDRTMYSIYQLMSELGMSI
jgi:hypothetical protein